MANPLDPQLASWISLILVGIAVAFAFSSNLPVAVLCLGLSSVIQIFFGRVNQSTSQQDSQIKQVEKRLSEKAPQTALQSISQLLNQIETIEKRLSEKESQVASPSPKPVKRGRVMIFVDADNIFLSGIDNNQNVSYEKMVDHLFTGASIKVDAIFYFNNMTRLDNVITTMQSAGFKIVRPGPRSDDSPDRPTDLDPEIIRDLDAYKDDYDTGVLASGDKHFVDSVKQLVRQGKRIEVVGFESTMNRGLIRFSSHYVDIMSLEGVCEPRLVKKGKPKENQS